MHRAIALFFTKKTAVARPKNNPANTTLSAS